MPRKPNTGQKFIPGISNRRVLVILAAVLLTTFASIIVAYHLTPPDSLTMSTGFERGAYANFGERYKKILAREKIRLELLTSSGSVENLKRLGDRSLRVDAGFVQDATSSPSEMKDLVSLGAVCYSPLWVFYRSRETWDDLSRLKGKKIGIGPEGSGARKLSMDLLKASGAAEPPTLLLDIPSAAANQALLEGTLDVVMIIGTEDNELVRELLYAKKIKLMSFKHAEAYSRLFPALSHIILPEGILNLSEKMPSRDIHLVATTTSLIVRKSLHPALQYLLLDAAMEIHSSASWLNKRGEFPSPKELESPLSTYAERFYKKGRPFLLDYLPFGMAVLVDRLILILVPVAIVLIPLMRGIPWVYSWRNRRKFYRWFGELKNLESEVMNNSEPEKVLEYQRRLDQIEASVNRIRVPLTFFGEVYRLKEHVDSVRGKLAQLTPHSKQDYS
ncbi:MAG TPA: TAXI family TRAP transporter solute-binding subunit [Thermodesulfobacteriota bacterium]|nr:TAXI family TRAP transporter solute-binding subunit [Thermodesulfobacteriota bacterium]